MNFLNTDNKFWQFILKIINLIWLNLLWLICCIPIFTIGAATSALYYAVQKNIKNDLGNSTQQFFRGFRESFKQATILWLILFALCMLFSYDLAFFENYGKDGHPIFYALHYVWYVTLLIEIIYYLYLFPYIARFSNTTKNIFMNASLLIVRHPVQLLKVLGFAAFAVFMIWFLPPLLFIAPAVAFWQISFVLEKLYERYMTPEDLALQRRRYGKGEDFEDTDDKG